MYHTQDYSQAPCYYDAVCQRVGVLQHLQTLLSIDATLSDVARVVQDFQQEFGPQEQLEHVIQSMVGSSLRTQIALRKTRVHC